VGWTGPPSNDVPPPEARGQRLLEWARQWSYAHPRLKLVAREGWAAARLGATAVHLPTPFDPPEFADLQALGGRPDPEGPDREGPGPSVLVMSFRGWSTHVVIEALVAKALERRGCRVAVLTCGGRLPTCDVVPAPFAPPTPCLSCSGYVHDGVAAASLHLLDLSDLLDVRSRVARASSTVSAATNVAQCRATMGAHLPVGRLVETSVAWALSTGDVDDTDPLALKTYRRFLAAGLVVEEAWLRALDTIQPDRVFLLNGSFFAERIMAELADERGIPVVRYERGFLPSTVLVSRWEAERNDLDPGEEAWKKAAITPLGQSQHREVREYLEGRTRGSRILNAFWTEGRPDPAVVRGQLGLEEAQPLVSAFCNILWDSAVQGRDVAFAGMLAWLEDALAWARNSPRIHLVIRVHPAEVKLRNHPSRDPVIAHLHDVMATPVDNVTVVGPDDPMNSYALAAASDVGLVYTSTMGLEMACAGIPVVVAGATHFGRRGFTWDPPDAQSYWQTVNRLLSGAERLDPGRRELAERYAHLFFFRFHQTIASLEEPGQSRVRLRNSAATAIGGGSDPGLDRVVGAVLDLQGSLVTPAG